MSIIQRRETEVWRDNYLAEEGLVLNLHVYSVPFPLQSYKEEKQDLKGRFVNHDTRSQGTIM